MPELKIQDLNDLYNKSINEDSDLYAEQRSNVLLIAGEHYARKTSNHLERIRSSSQLSNEQKIRLTKNHIQRIIKIYVNNLINSAPGAHAVPANPKENHDIKSAELHNSVLAHIKYENALDKKVIQFANDYCGIGECFVKIFWDESKGKTIDIGQEYDPASGMIYNKKMMSGDIVFERVYGFNVFRDPTAKDFDDASFIGYRKLVDVKVLQNMYRGDEEKLSFIEPTSEGTYTVFNGNNGKYEEQKDKCLIREYYYRPSMMYPNGYYYITTMKGILFEGELPGGIFPILYVGFDEIQTSPRYRSIIKQLRPYQAEINRAASKIAEHQITLGDDKIIYQAGSKIAQGENLSGVRGIKVTGAPPTILPGRDGSQYANYINTQIAEMYQVALVSESMEDKMSNNVDAYSMLFRNMREKKRFSIYLQKFESFIKELYKTSLELFRLHAPDSMVIPVIGKNEIVNISEFKNTNNMSYQIKIEASSEDIESQMGKQLTLNNVLQYASAQLKPNDIAKIVNSMPFITKDQALKDLTLFDDVVDSYILSIDRGQPFEISRYISQDLIINKITKRISETDFLYLPDNIKQLFDQKLKEHEQIKTQQLQDASALNSQFIPAGGFLVGVDFYINPDPQNPQKTRRARVPYESLAWLIQRLQAQGLDQESLYSMQQANLQDMAQIGAQDAMDNKMQQDVQNLSMVNENKVNPVTEVV